MGAVSQRSHSALGLMHVCINLLTAGWKNNLPQRQNGKWSGEQTRGRASLQIDPPRFRPIALCVPLTQRFIMQTLPFPKIHIETILDKHGRQSERPALSREAAAPGERSTQCISSLASGTLKREAGRGGAGGRRPRARDCQRGNTKDGAMIKKLPRPPCTRPGEGSQPESVNTWKHTVQLHVLTAHACACSSDTVLPLVSVVVVPVLQVEVGLAPNISY